MYLLKNTESPVGVYVTLKGLKKSTIFSRITIDIKFLKMRGLSVHCFLINISLEPELQIVFTLYIQKGRCTKIFKETIQKTISVLNKNLSQRVI